MAASNPTAEKDPFAALPALRMPDQFLATAENAEVRKLGYLAIISLDGGSKAFTRRECVELMQWLEALVNTHDE